MPDVEKGGDNYHNAHGGVSMPMLDGAASSKEIIVPKYENEKIIASNPKHDLEERLETY